MTGSPVDHAVLINNARYFAYQLADFVAAEHAYRQVLALKPNDIEALAGVGQGLCRRRRLAEGRQYLLKAARIMLRHGKKADVQSMLALAEQLQQWAELEAAMQLYRAAAKQAPKNPVAQFGLANCLYHLNYVDQALPVLASALKWAPDDASVQLLQALCETENCQHTQAEQRLNQLINSNAPPALRARACLEWAKILDKKTCYAQAFDLMQQAWALQALIIKSSGVDSGFIFQRIASYKQGYDQALLQRWTSGDFADGLPLPVFVIGFLRSGTTLVERVLSAHPEIVVSDENQLLDDLIDELGRLSGVTGNVPEALRGLDVEQARHLRQFYWQRVREEFPPAAQKRRFINKVALNSLEIGLISTLFPEARLIFVLRDPRDVCLSCASQAFTPSVATINLLSWEGIARQYAAVMDLWLSLRDSLSTDYLELRYEDVVGDFENRFRQVFTFLGLDWRAEIMRYHEKVAGQYIATPSFSAVAQPLYQSALARWRNYADPLDVILPGLLPYIKAFGYPIG